MPFNLTPWDKNNLKRVHPDLVRVIERAAADTDMRFVILEGRRSFARQRQMVERGSSTTMHSRHLTGHAVDIAPVDDNGKVSWAWPLYYRLAPIIKASAKSEGVPVDWGGDWRTFKDGPHWELSRKKYPA
jgi:peptidoglycan LD-endopeptidase CwlK